LPSRLYRKYGYVVSLEFNSEGLERSRRRTGEVLPFKREGAAVAVANEVSLLAMVFNHAPQVRADAGECLDLALGVAEQIDWLLIEFYAFDAVGRDVLRLGDENLSRSLSRSFGGIRY
jgi:hypothetical protein